MSPSDQRDVPDVPQPLFTRPTESSEDEQSTGLFQPRPQDVRPWALFEQGAETAVEDAAFENAASEAEPELQASSEDAMSPEGSEPAAEEPGEGLDELLGTPEDLAELLDGTLEDAASSPEPGEEGDGVEEGPVEGAESAPEQEPLLAGCPNCEATEAAAAASLDATIEALQLPYLEGAQVLQRAAADVSKDFIQNLLQLSVELASTILHRSAALDPKVVLGNLDHALEIAGPVSELTIRCHPDDAELLRLEGPAHAERVTGRLVDVQVSPSDAVERGACIVDFGDGLIDARWQVQLDRLAAAVSPTLIHHAAEAAQTIALETMTVTEPQFVASPETQPPTEAFEAQEAEEALEAAEAEEALEATEADVEEPAEAEVGDVGPEPDVDGMGAEVPAEEPDMAEVQAGEHDGEEDTE